MEDSRNPRDPNNAGNPGDFHDPHDSEAGGDSTAARIEDWLRGLRSQRAGGDAAGRTGRGAPGPADDPAEAFLKAAKRLAASPRAQQALARRLAEGGADGSDPSLRTLARVLETLGRELSGVLGGAGSGLPSGGA
ncbi:MAG: hypothetical protein ACRDJN_10190, partial [Chloroflexota bacterium]